MSDFISREAAIKTHCSCCGWQGNVDLPCDGCKEPDNFRAIPAADVREVVLCKDCKHYPTNDGVGTELDFPDFCCPANRSDPYYSYKPSPEWFCGNGERKERR